MKAWEVVFDELREGDEVVSAVGVGGDGLDLGAAVLLLIDLGDCRVGVDSAHF